ncbi:MAG: protoporphyrinogen oxidase [Pyrinomonadaceae bacterium]
MSTVSHRTRRIVVIGGGISGLAAAHRLCEPVAQDNSSARNSSGERSLTDAPEVLLLEASARCGGTIRTEEREGFLLEGGPDSFISEKPEVVALAKRLGIANRLIETNDLHRRSFVVRGGRLHPTPEGFQLLAPSRMWPFVTTPIFSWRGKARMACDLLLPRRFDESVAAEESLAAFVRRRFGREALERMAQPMVGGIYTADPELLSLRATMPRFLDMERAHRSLIWAMWRAAHKQKSPRDKAQTNGTSGARYSLFLTFDGGMKTLTDALVARLPRDCVQTNHAVERLAFDVATNQWLIKTSAGQTIRADAVCLALPAHTAARLLRGIDAALADELDAISYASTATINLAYRRESVPHPLDGFGFVVPFIEGRATLACTFSSLKFAGRAPAGHVLLRAFVGGALQPEMFALTDEEMIAAVSRDMRELLGIRDAPLFSQVRRWERSMPQYHLGHLERIVRVRAHLANFPTLRLAGNAYTGAGLPDCVRSGETAAVELLSNVTREARVG